MRSAFRQSNFADRFRDIVFLTISFCADDLTNLTLSLAPLRYIHGDQVLGCSQHAGDLSIHCLLRIQNGQDKNKILVRKQGKKTGTEAMKTVGSWNETHLFNRASIMGPSLFSTVLQRLGPKESR